MRRIYF
jgi:hypothetical protein